MKRPIKHLQRDRFGTFYFRLTIDGHTLRRSLHTKDAARATMLASRLNYEFAMASTPKEPTVLQIVEAFKKQGRKFDAEFPDGTKITGINNDDDLRRAKELMLTRIEAIGPIEPSLQPLRAPQSPHKTKFSKATAAYLAEKALDNEAKTLHDKRATYAAFIAHAGDAALGLIDKPKAVAFKQHLMQGNAGAQRINKKIGHMADFFSWAVNHGEAAENPFEKLRISSKSKLAEQVKSYEPFTEEELKKIFNSKGWNKYAKAPHFKLLPILLLYTGARPNELAGMLLDDIRQEQGIDYFSIRASKNSNSQRKIPFHKEILASSFMDYLAERRRDDPNGRLFPHLPPSKNGYAKNISRRLKEIYLPTLGFRDPRKRLYSFRSTFITRMSELNVNPAMLMAIVGHYEQKAVDLSSPHFKNYQGAKLLSALKSAIDLFDFRLQIAV